MSTVVGARTHKYAQVLGDAVDLEERPVGVDVAELRPDAVDEFGGGDGPDGSEASKTTEVLDLTTGEFSLGPALLSSHESARAVCV